MQSISYLLDRCRESSSNRKGSRVISFRDNQKVAESLIALNVYNKASRIADLPEAFGPKIAASPSHCADS